MGDATMRNKALKTAILLVFTVGASGCGEIQMPMTLALEDGSNIEIEMVAPLTLPLGTTYLEGGVMTVMTANIDLLGLLLHVPMFGVIEIDQLLFGGTEFSILGTATGTLCTIPNPNGSSGGSVLIDIFGGHIDFYMDLDTAIMVTNPDLAANLPDGFQFTMSVDEGADISLPELLAMAFGNADGVLSITQVLDEEFETEILPGFLATLHISGELALATANEFPTGLLMDECIDFLGL
jgi:hypothetical protein